MRRRRSTSRRRTFSRRRTSVRRSFRAAPRRRAMRTGRRRAGTRTVRIELVHSGVGNRLAAPGLLAGTGLAAPAGPPKKSHF